MCQLFTNSIPRPCQQEPKASGQNRSCHTAAGSASNSTLPVCVQHPYYQINHGHAAANQNCAAYLGHQKCHCCQNRCQNLQQHLYRFFSPANHGNHHRQQHRTEHRQIVCIAESQRSCLGLSHNAGHCSQRLYQEAVVIADSVMFQQRQHTNGNAQNHQTPPDKLYHFFPVYPVPGRRKHNAVADHCQVAFIQLVAPQPCNPGIWRCNGGDQSQNPVDPDTDSKCQSNTCERRFPFWLQCKPLIKEPDERSPCNQQQKYLTAKLLEIGNLIGGEIIGLLNFCRHNPIDLPRQKRQQAQTHCQYFSGKRQLPGRCRNFYRRSPIFCFHKVPLPAHPICCSSDRKRSRRRFCP